MNVVLLKLDALSIILSELCTLVERGLNVLFRHSQIISSTYWAPTPVFLLNSSLNEHVGLVCLNRKPNNWLYVSMRPS